MKPPRPLLVGGLLALGAFAACHGEPAAGRETGPAVLVLALPASLGQPERPPVEYDHQKHDQALQGEACTRCHVEGEGGQGLRFVLRGVEGVRDAKDYTARVHALCVGCHEARGKAGQQTGPVLCGSCHVEQAAARSQRVRPRLDLSLHARHVLAEQEKCETCHHVLDEAQQKLVYKKGAEDACRACHGAVAQGKSPTLRDAVHDQCVNCHHAATAAGQAHGPVDCAGCHDQARLAAVQRLDPVPRLLRGQRDRFWIAAPDGKAGPVHFAHLQHEQHATACADCHHQGLARCGTCHLLLGDARGQGVTREQAYHDEHSTHSCVGCHKARTADKACAGCHHAMHGLPGRASCEVCHQGAPIAASGALLHVVDLSGTAPHRPELPAPELPAYGENFPEQITIDLLRRNYQGSPFPHGKIVTAIVGKLVDDRLARRFHQSVDTLCAGCHHHSPVGQRPPACRSCHALDAQPGRDQPGLKVAYHRQCMGCHEAIGHRAVGCEDCHKKASAEVAP